MPAGPVVASWRAPARRRPRSTAADSGPRPSHSSPDSEVAERLGLDRPARPSASRTVVPSAVQSPEIAVTMRTGTSLFPAPKASSVTTHRGPSHRSLSPVAHLTSNPSSAANSRSKRVGTCRVGASVRVARSGGARVALVVRRSLGPPTCVELAPRGRHHSRPSADGERMPRAVRITFALLVCLLLVPAAACAQPLFSDSLSSPDGLITNEYAYWNPGDSAAHRSADWEMDSGSRFARAGAAWTGPVTDNCDPDRDSATCTNSGVFRLNTKRRDFDAVRVEMRLRANAFDDRDESADPDTPAVDWDGVHIWLHYVDEYELYYASVNRRDGSVVIKKKCRGGDDNGGTYYELASASGFPVPTGAWQQVGASIQTNADRTVTIKLYREGQQLIEAIDTGVGCAAVIASGAVGVRGDNLDFDIDDFTVSALAAEPEPLPDPAPTPDPVIGKQPT